MADKSLKMSKILLTPKSSFFEPFLTTFQALSPPFPLLWSTKFSPPGAKIYFPPLPAQFLPSPAANRRAQVCLWTSIYANGNGIQFHLFGSFQDENGVSALRFCSQFGHLSMCSLLLDVFGAEVDLADKDGCTPLLAATEAGIIEVTNPCRCCCRRRRCSCLYCYYHCEYCCWYCCFC